MTPHSRALDADRHADRRAEAELADGLGDRARGAGVVVDPRRPAGLEHQRGHVPPAEPCPGADGEGSAGAAPRGDHRCRAVRVIPGHRRVIGAQQPPGLLGDRGEHLLRRRRAGHQRRHPPQRRLLPGEPVIAGSPAARHAISASVSAPSIVPGQEPVRDEPSAESSRLSRPACADGGGAAPEHLSARYRRVVRSRQGDASRSFRIPVQRLAGCRF